MTYKRPPGWTDENAPEEDDIAEDDRGITIGHGSSLSTREKRIVRRFYLICAIIAALAVLWIFHLMGWF